MSTAQKTSAQKEKPRSGCKRCGASAPHVPCPVCEGRGCLSTREIAEKLGLQEALDLTEVTSAAIAKAFDGRLFKSMEEAKKIERERSDQMLAAERKRLGEVERRLQDQLKQQAAALTQLREERAGSEARARVAEDALAKRRSQPAAVGRIAERDFASLVGAQADFRVSPKLPRGGDYDVWLKVPTVDGALVELDEPILVDVKKESAALQQSALSKLVRDCRARGRLMGALVADRMDDIAEVFGSPRVRLVEGVTVLLTSVEAFPMEMRLLGAYFRHLLEARRSGDESVVAALATALGEVMQLVTEIESQVDKVATVLERQVTDLRESLVGKGCARIRAVLANARQRMNGRVAAERQLHLPTDDN